jgi:predicted nucleic acid-binding protein
MTVVLDTSFLFALTDLTDRNHDRVLAVVQSINEVRTSGDAEIYC